MPRFSVRPHPPAAPPPPLPAPPPAPAAPLRSLPTPLAARALSPAHPPATHIPIPRRSHTGTPLPSDIPPSPPPPPAPHFPIPRRSDTGPHPRSDIPAPLRSHIYSAQIVPPFAPPAP